MNWKEDKIPIIIASVLAGLPLIIFIISWIISYIKSGLSEEFLVSGFLIIPVLVIVIIWWGAIYFFSKQAVKAYREEYGNKKKIKNN